MTDLEGLAPLPTTRARAHEVADYLADVIAQRLAPGERLGTKEDIRRLTRVSVSTVNEATRLLEERGLISLRPGPNGGIFAAAPNPMVKLGQLFLQVHDDPERFSEAGAIRDALEPLIARDACLHRTDDDVEALTHLLATMESSQHELDDFLRADLALHQRIAAVTDRDLLSGVYLAVLKIQREQISAPLQSHLPSLEHTHHRFEIHRDLIQAIATGDVEAAHDAAIRHAQRTEPITESRHDHGTVGADVDEATK